MGTYLVERRQPVIARALLCDQILRGVIFEIKAHIDVHALVRSIVGRTSGPAPHDAGVTGGRGRRGRAAGHVVAAIALLVSARDRSRSLCRLGSNDRVYRSPIAGHEPTEQHVPVEQLLEHRTHVLATCVR